MKYTWIGPTGYNGTLGRNVVNGAETEIDGSVANRLLELKLLKPKPTKKTATKEK